LGGFNPRAPAERDNLDQNVSALVLVSIHALLRSATSLLAKPVWFYRGFNPRAPAERDEADYNYMMSFAEFQSTRSCGARR